MTRDESYGGRPAAGRTCLAEAVLAERSAGTEGFGTACCDAGTPAEAAAGRRAEEAAGSASSAGTGRND